MPAVKEEDLLKQVRFVFKGSVSKLNASNVPEVKADRSTAVVRVDEVIQAPEVFADVAGHEITVKLPANERVTPGQRAVFYANGLMSGENLAVQAVALRRTQGLAFAVRTPSVEPAQNLHDQVVRERLDTADVVVAGKVVNVRLPEEQKPAATRGVHGLRAEPTGRSRQISEHDPKWREAVVQIHSVEKGKHKGKQAVIRFPGSDDVRWHRAPKFEPGQEGLFILHKPQKPATPKRGVRGLLAVASPDEVENPDAYTALHPADFQPLRKHAEIRTLLKAQTPPSRG
jgi:hypothetical protein